MTMNEHSHPAENENHPKMERRQALQTMLSVTLMGVGFSGFAKQALAKDDANDLAKAVSKAGFRPNLDPEISCRPIDEHKSGGTNGDCQVFTCDPSGTNGKFICSNGNAMEFDCTDTFTCPKFTCGHNDFGTACGSGQPAFQCGPNPGPFNCLDSYN